MFNEIEFIKTINWVTYVNKRRLAITANGKVKQEKCNAHAPIRIIDIRNEIKKKKKRLTIQDMSID